MKHINNFKEYKSTNEGIGTILTFVTSGYFLYKFLKGLMNDVRIKNSKNKMKDLKKELFLRIMYNIAEMEEIPVMELNDRYYIATNIDNLNVKIKLFKDPKKVEIEIEKSPEDINFELSDKNYNDFLDILRIKNKSQK